jgi:hypothetical protein
MKNHSETVSTNHILFTLSWGPTTCVKLWPSYFINGYHFHTRSYAEGKSTMNYGVCVQSSSIDFYGELEEIIEVEYPGLSTMKVVLFKCHWFDPTRGTRVHPKYKLVEIDQKKKYKKYDPFILAQQAIQVYYTKIPSLKRDKVDWRAVCKTKARRKIEQHWTEREQQWSDTVAFQQDNVSESIEPVTYDIANLRDPSGVVIDVDEDEIRGSNMIENADLTSDTETSHQIDSSDEDENEDKDDEDEGECHNESEDSDEGF